MVLLISKQSWRYRADEICITTDTESFSGYWILNFWDGIKFVKNSRPYMERNIFGGDVYDYTWNYMQSYIR